MRVSLCSQGEEKKAPAGIALSLLIHNDLPALGLRGTVRWAAWLRLACSLLMLPAGRTPSGQPSAVYLAPLGSAHHFRLIKPLHFVVLETTPQLLPLSLMCQTRLQALPAVAFVRVSSLLHACSRYPR